MRINSMDETYENVTVFGIPMLFTCMRVDEDTVPDGLYVYEVRHDDDMQGIPVQIAKYVMVNHWGTLISKHELSLRESEFINNAYLDIGESDWCYEGTRETIMEFMNCD